MYYVRLVLCMLDLLCMSALDSDGYFMYYITAGAFILTGISCLPLFKKGKKKK